MLNSPPEPNKIKKTSIFVNCTITKATLKICRRLSVKVVKNFHFVIVHGFIEHFKLFEGKTPICVTVALVYIYSKFNVLYKGVILRLSLVLIHKLKAFQKIIQSKSQEKINMCKKDSDSYSESCTSSSNLEDFVKIVHAY